MRLNISRFELCSPLIKTLEISRSPGVPYRTVRNWRFLLLHSSDRVLLPNLRRLSLTTRRETVEDHLDWITMFLSPSLAEINICKFNGPIWVGLSTSAKLLRRIARSCPRIQVLYITPGEPGGDTVSGGIVAPHPYAWWYEHVEFSSSTVHLHRPIRGFFNLRSLTSSVAILCPKAFLEISRLHFLESLALKSSATKGPV